VVIVGAGFGGLSAARALRRAPVDLLVVDRNNYHGFWPFLYQVATGILETQEVAYPVRSLLSRQKNVDFRMANVTGVDLAQREVRTDRGSYPYDYLILAGGSSTNYFGNDAIADCSHGLKDIDDADRLRNHILRRFEQAAAEPDEARRDALMSFVVVGAGPTGVELAGQLALLARRTLPREFPSLDLAQTRVTLANAGASILESFPDPLQRHARRRLERLGIDLKMNATVEAVEPGVVRFGDGTSTRAGTVVWTAGVRAADLSESVSAPLGTGGRIRVEPTLNLESNPEVFVVGDMSYLEGHHDNRAYPMVAQVAMQQGRRAGQNIRAAIAGRRMRPFRYLDKGQMAIIGPRSAIVNAFGVRLRGTAGWLAWLALHIVYLRGLRNRLVVLVDWFAVILSPTRGTGVITRRTPEPDHAGDVEACELCLARSARGPHRRTAA
jgi:NADH dehydrogenase